MAEVITWALVAIGFSTILAISALMWTRNIDDHSE